MRIIHLLYSLKPGGAENVALNYCKVLNTMGVNSTIIGHKGDAVYEEILRNNADVEYDLDSSMLEKDVVIFVHCNQWLYGLLKYLPIIKFKGIRVVYIQHLNYSFTKFLSVAALVNIICTDFIRITPITEKLVDRYILVKKHFIVNFFIERYSKFDWPEIRTHLRNELKIDPQKTVICFSAIFKPGKGLQDFIELAARCKTDDSKVFLLVGDGPEKLIAEKYQEKNLIWVGRVNDVEKYLIASDIYFFPSRNEMMPMALLEAINTEKSIIAYPTIINDFLLRQKTFEMITSPGIFQDDLPCGKNLTHYDGDYGRKQLKKLLNL